MQETAGGDVARYMQPSITAVEDPFNQPTAANAVRRPTKPTGRRVKVNQSNYWRPCTEEAQEEQRKEH